MISSESINYSKYSIINEQNTNISNDLKISINNQTKEIENTDLNLNSIIPNEDEKDKSKLLSISEKEKEQNNDLLYGNKIENINPKYLGKSLAFFYNSRGDPRITIGPDCKNIFINI